jgi:hypothetical protein
VFQTQTQNGKRICPTVSVPRERKTVIQKQEFITQQYQKHSSSLRCLRAIFQLLHEPV